MSYSFDSVQNMGRAIRYNATAGTYTVVDISATATFDYFRDDAIAGDILYIGISSSPGNPFHTVTFNVGTPLVASAITVAWEYYKYSVGWTALPGIVDGTNAFQNSGSNIVEFSSAGDWSSGVSASRFYNTINSVTITCIRCRITSITNMTEGGANNTNLVTYKDLTIRVSSEASCTATAIYNASVAGGWGVVSTTNGNEFFMNASLYLSSSSFTSSNEYIRIGSAANYVGCLLQADSFQLGTLDAAGVGTNGSKLVVYQRDALTNGWGINNGKFYGSHIWTTSPGNYSTFGVTVDLVDSIFTSTSSSIYFTIGMTGLCRRSVLNANSYIFYSTSGFTVDAPVIPYGVTGATMGYGTAVMSNVIFPSGALVYLVPNTYQSIVSSANLINCTIADAGLVLSGVCDASDHYSYKKYTFDVKVVDSVGSPIQSATATLKDNTSATTFSASTDSNGNITQQTVITYQKKWLALTSTSVPTAFYPFTITITKVGYTTVSITLPSVEAKQTLIFSILKTGTATGRLLS